MTYSILEFLLCSSPGLKMAVLDLCLQGLQVLHEQTVIGKPTNWLPDLPYKENDIEDH